MSSPLYEIHDLKQSYGKGQPALDIAELSIRSSGITGLVGPNGSGKSTLLKVLSFLIPYKSGRIIFDGRPAEGREESIRREVTYMLQDSYLLNRSVYENIAYGLKLRGNIPDIKVRVNESLIQVGLDPEKFAKRAWYQLSGGEAQRVALAARLALRPRVLLLDEPTANVDEANAQLVMEAAVSAAKEYGAAVIVATHDLAWLYEMSTDIVSLYRGQVVGSGAENLLQGKWNNSGGCMVREFTDGQAVFAYPPQTVRANAAMINPADVRIAVGRPRTAHEVNVIGGRIVQMTLERATGSVLVSTEVGGNVIKTRVGAAELDRLGLFPSQEVYLTFPYSAVRWIL